MCTERADSTVYSAGSAGKLAHDKADSIYQMHKEVPGHNETAQNVKSPLAPKLFVPLRRFLLMPEVCKRKKQWLNAEYSRPPWGISRTVV